MLGSPGEAPAPPVLSRAALLRCLLALGLLLPLLLVPWGSQVLLRARLRVLLLFWFQRQGGRLFWQSWCCSTWGESTVEVTLRLRVLPVLSALPSSRGAKQSQLLITLRFLLPNISLLTWSYPDLTVPKVLLKGSSGTVSQLSEFRTNGGINSCSGRENIF